MVISVISDSRFFAADLNFSIFRINFDCLLQVLTFELFSSDFSSQIFSSDLGLDFFNLNWVFEFFLSESDLFGFSIRFQLFNFFHKILNVWYFSSDLKIYLIFRFFSSCMSLWIFFTFNLLGFLTKIELLFQLIWAFEF